MDNPLRGVMLFIGATVLFSCSDAMAKFLGQTLHPVEIGWIRYVMFVVLAAGVVARSGRRRLWVRNPLVHLVRGLGLVGSALAFVFALRYLPMADATAIGFVSPLMISLLSVPMLGEVVGAKRWAAIVIGLIGVLLVVRPGEGALQIGAVLVLLSSLAWAVASVLTRRIAGVEDAGTTLLWSAVSGLLVLSLLLPLVFEWPRSYELAICSLLGVVASAGQGLMVLAYRHAAASLLAPFSYTQLIWSTALGYLVFGALPDAWTLMGAAVIVVSGFYVVQQERARTARG
jgi:drug/metabolite transporter (DMT)-like permease